MSFWARFVGLAPDMALALSLAKRARELTIGLPVLRRLAGDRGAASAPPLD